MSRCPLAVMIRLLLYSMAGLVVLAVVWPVMRSAQPQPPESRCLSNAKQLSIGLLMYSQDYDDLSPPTAGWNGLVYPYVKSQDLFRCPSEILKAYPSYAMNSRLAGADSSKIAEPQRTVLVFDSIPGRNRSGGPELLPNPPRHPGGQVLGLADGHSRTVPPQQMSVYVWAQVPSRPNSGKGAAARRVAE